MNQPSFAGKQPQAVRTEPAARALPPAEVEHRVRVRFYRRMKLQRVFALEVTLQQTSSGRAPSNGATSPVFVRATVPGAHVTPPEQTLDPVVPGSRAVFYVTPYAKGKLRGARLEVFHQGKPVQEITLPMRGVTQRLTWLLAALTVLVPAFLLYTTKYNKLQGKVPRVVPAPEPMHVGIVVPKKLTPKPDGDKPEAEPGKGLAPRGQTITIMDIGKPGELLEQQINANVPHVPDEIREEYRWALPVTDQAAWAVGEAYEWACEQADEKLSFWVGLGLLFLTLLSAVAHRSIRGTRRGKPLRLSAAGALPVHD